MSPFSLLVNGKPRIKTAGFNWNGLENVKVAGGLEKDFEIRNRETGYQL